jgi:hypothetical protein
MKKSTLGPGLGSMSGPPWPPIIRIFQQEKPGAVHAGVAQVEKSRWRSLCALRTSSRINGHLAQREWMLYCAKMRVGEDIGFCCALICQILFCVSLLAAEKACHRDQKAKRSSNAA